MIIKFLKRLDIRLIGIFIVIAFLWNTQVVYPLKIFVVFMHEVSHGLAALATGGSIKEIQIVQQEGGHAVTLGGSRFWTLTAGYLGSLVWGGLILILAARTHLGKLISAVIGVGMVLISAFYLRNSFGFLFGVGFGGGLIIIGRFLPESINGWLLRVIGLTSCLYAILDIKSDILDRFPASIRCPYAPRRSDTVHSDHCVGGFMDGDCNRCNPMRPLYCWQRQKSADGIGQWRLNFETVTWQTTQGFSQTGVTSG